jgi:hypothetical protein
VKLATCHPERAHYARGLCNACWQNERYTKNPLPQRERVRKWAHDHRAQVLARKKAYYLRLHPHSGSRATQQPRAPGIILPKVIELPELKEPPIPKEWWKLQDSDTPRRWILEAA